MLYLKNNNYEILMKLEYKILDKIEYKKDCKKEFD